MDVHPGYTHHENPAPHIDLSYDLSAIDNFDWDQWWTVDQSNYPVPPGLSAGYPYHEQHHFNDFIPNYETTPSSSHRTGSIPSQDHSISPGTYVLPSPEASSSNAESRRDSTIIQPEKPRQKRSRTDSAAAKPARRSYTRKSKGKAKAEVEEEEDPAPRRKRSSTSKDVSTDLNRITSNKVRIKKKEDEIRLEATERDMKKVNHDLTSHVTNLTAEVYNLKMRLLQHTDCDCHLIQEYIAREAHRYIHDLGDDKRRPSLDNMGSTIAAREA
ncbi:hypothetical protein FGRMN_7196 [Fusarium graminum]|nr:hypothetical protein FGRMN_7196 [Fusarium graminum]